jgi:alanyl-tRNA synthetase
MIRRIKEWLLEYHKERGFVWYESFPLITDDPTVLFVNATITPFKNFFTDSCIIPHNYALIQRCLRVGGGATQFEEARVNANHSSLFEMFGSGLFNYSCQLAVKYFLDMLLCIGLSKEKILFTIPQNTEFEKSLIECGISESSVFVIEKNGEFWQEWHFGKNELVGKGLTAIYSRSTKKVVSIEDMASNSGSFLEIGNLIEIFGNADGKNTTSISRKGFEVGIGVERLACVLQERTLYEIVPYSSLAEVIRVQLEFYGGEFDFGTIRLLTDCLRSINALIQGGLRPGNKLHAFVLRKLIRLALETIWISVGRIFSPMAIIDDFAKADVPENARLITGVVHEEERAFLTVLIKGKKIIADNPSLSSEVLRSTYGIRQSLVPLL